MKIRMCRDSVRVQADRLWSFRLELAEKINGVDIPLEELYRLVQSCDHDPELVLLYIADIVSVRDGRVSLSREGKRLLELVRSVMSRGLPCL